jgi:hypothetical protein
MPNEDDLILEINEADKTPEMDIIENQIYTITCLLDIEQVPYDEWDADMVKIIGRAMKIIYNQQKKLL